MIKVTIELYPHGKSKGKKKIAEGTIINDTTGTTDNGNYTYNFYEFMEIDGHKVPVNNMSGRTEGHDRRKNAWKLLKKIFKEMQ